MRDRRDDILLLADAFMQEVGTTVGRPAAGISEDARDQLLRHPWPGNVRELRNAIERAVILCEGGLVTSDHLPIAVGTRPAPAPALSSSSPHVLPPGGIKLEAVERDLVQKALANARNNKSLAAKLLGVPRGPVLLAAQAPRADRCSPVAAAGGRLVIGRGFLRQGM